MPNGSAWDTLAGMWKSCVPLSLATLMGVTVVVEPPRDDHPSDTSELLATYVPAPAARSFDAMVASAEAFLQGLTEEHRAESRFPLDDPERAAWTNLPPRAEENGVRLGDLAAGELRLALDLLGTVLSESGYAKVRDILLADDKLLRNGEPRVGFGAENFWLVVFGTPHATEPWALQLDGHHLGLNLSFAAGKMTMDPSFIGTQPAAYARGDETVRPMHDELARAFAVVASLTEAQRERAIVAERRGRVEAGPGRDGHVPSTEGLPTSELTEDQRAKLRALIESYVSMLPDEYAAARMKAIDADLADLWFSWRGPTANPSDVSYRVQGANLLLEFACQDLGGNPLDHLHAIVRDPGNDYGAGF